MMLSAGIVLGNLFLPLLEKKIGWTNIILICICILGVDLFSLYCIHNTIYTLIIYGINGVCFTYWVFIVSKIQSLTTAHFQGRLQSLFTSVSANYVIIFYVILERSSHSITTVDCYLILSHLVL